MNQSRQCWLSGPVAIGFANWRVTLAWDSQCRGICDSCSQTPERSQKPQCLDFVDFGKWSFDRCHRGTSKFHLAMSKLISVREAWFYNLSPFLTKEISLVLDLILYAWLLLPQVFAIVDLQNASYQSLSWSETSRCHGFWLIPFEFTSLQGTGNFRHDLTPALCIH